LPFNEDRDCGLYENLQEFTTVILSHVSEIKAIFVFTVQGKLCVQIFYSKGNNRINTPSPKRSISRLKFIKAYAEQPVSGKPIGTGLASIESAATSTTEHSKILNNSVPGKTEKHDGE
jgi:hypothetical protein